MRFRFKALSASCSFLDLFFYFSLFGEFIHSYVLQAVLVHRSLHVLHVLLEHISGDENRFEARYL